MLSVGVNPLLGVGCLMRLTDQRADHALTPALPTWVKRVAGSRGS